MPINAATGSPGWAGFPRESVPDAYSGRGAVKVINHFGDEVTKVFSA
jgi:hypothetical protein